MSVSRKSKLTAFHVAGSFNKLRTSHIYEANLLLTEKENNEVVSSKMYASVEATNKLSGFRGVMVQSLLNNLIVAHLLHS
jgi:hypothetical protein